MKLLEKIVYFSFLKDLMHIAKTETSFSFSNPSVSFYIETSHLICTANQVNVFYLKCNTGLK